MAITIDDIKALDFGYLSGADLLLYCPSQYIIKQYISNPDSIQTGCDIAYNEIFSYLSTRYQIDLEFVKTGTDRYYLLVKIVAIAALRNILAEFQNLSDTLKTHFSWLDKTLQGIREGQISLINIEIQSTSVASETKLIKSIYKTLG
jgi:phage gp36-like protein